MLLRAACPALLLVLSACTTAPPQWQPPLGSNAVFDAAPGAAPELQLIVADLRLGPNAVGVAHYHPWEEYLYVIEGEAWLELAGEEPRRLVAGEHFVIPARRVHTPRAGPDGMRAMVTRVHRQGDPVSVPVNAPAPQ